MKIGFIGLGNLGSAILSHLISINATSIYIWNRDKDKCTGKDASICKTPKELSSLCDIVFICLFDSNAVDCVFNQSDGLLASNLKGKIIVDLSTNHYKEVLKFHAYAKRGSFYYLESPVLGSVVPALKGLLTILVSGDKKAYTKAEPYLQQVGKKLFFLEEEGLASKMKVINNFVLGNFMVSLAEALSFAEATGLDKAAILDILANGGGSSLVLNAKTQKLVEEDFSPHFSSALLYKDLNCLYDLAYELKKPLLTPMLTKELYAKTFDKGISDLDVSSIYKLFQE